MEQNKYMFTKLNKLRQHNVSKNLFALLILQIANYIFPLLAWPILARQLGLEDFGILMILLSICALANILTDFGFNLSATYNIAQYHQAKQKDEINKLIGNIFFIKFILAFISITISINYIYLKINNTQIDIFSYTLMGFVIFIQAFQCVWLFHGIEKMKYITQATILSKIFYLIFLISILPLHQTINTALFCFLLSQTMMVCAYIYAIYKENYQIHRPTRTLVNEFKNSVGFFFSRVSVSLYTTINTLLIGQFVGASTAGLYSSAEKLYAGGASVSSMFSQALYPHMIKSGNIRLLFKLTFLAFIPFSLICMGVSVYAEEILVLIFGESFQAASEFLKLFLILMCITFISITIGYPGFAAMKKVQIANYTVMIGSICHLLGLSLLYLNDVITAKNILLMVIITETIILILRLSGLSYFCYKQKKEVIV